MKLDKSVIDKILEWSTLNELDYQLENLDLRFKHGDQSQSTLVENVCCDIRQLKLGWGE